MADYETSVYGEPHGRTSLASIRKHLQHPLAHLRTTHGQEREFFNHRNPSQVSQAADAT
jgi:hypothetical protein